MSDLSIERIEIIQFSSQPSNSERQKPSPHKTFGAGQFFVKIHSRSGPVGEYVTRKCPAYAIQQIEQVAPTLLGQPASHRERLWNKMKFVLRKSDRVGIGPLDIALWDLLGKTYGAPIHGLLGTYREEFPAYAATAHGTSQNGLATADDYADFAETCLEFGYRGYKIHTWPVPDGGYDIEADIELIRTVADRIGGKMDLMIDLSGKYSTFGDAVKIGRVCDELGFFWLEDPYGMSGNSIAGHRRLRDRVHTPILQLEHVRGVESHADFLVNEGTDFVRINPELDGGITGSMKIAHSAESLGADVEFNGPGPARRQCLAAIRNSNYYEITDVSPKIVDTDPIPYRGSYTDALDAPNTNGMIPALDGPGLGVDYNDRMIEDRMVQRFVYD